MFTTGLVSLSIHEALTFDGIEIALHPDLFSEPGPSGRPNVVGRSLGSATVNSMASSATNTLPKHHHRRHQSDSIAPFADDGKADDGRPPIMHTSSFSSAPTASNRRVEVGDMIEIRVWDPLPGGEKISSPPTLKRRSPPPSKDPSRGGSTSTSVTNEGPPLRKPSSTSATLEAAASTLQQSTVKSSSTSLQYSIDSSFPTVPQETKEEPLKEGDTSTVSSAERIKETTQLSSNPPSPKGDVPTATGIPPAFPRNRTDTGDPRVMTSKPPPVQRSRMITPIPPPSDTQEHRRRSSSFVQSNTANTTGSHVRDISDMTMDTILGSNLPDHGEDDAGAEEDDTLSRISSTHALRLSFVMLVTEKTLTSLKESARTQVSMLRQVADLYNLKYGDMVTVNRINKGEEASVVKAVSADFVTVTIKEYYISRGDMHFFQKSLIGRWIYEGQRLSNSIKGVHAHAREIRHGKRLAKSGIITDDTMITFRSRSARIFWLVQISSEMWDYASPYNSVGGSDEESSCEIYFDKFVTFMHRLFTKWQELEVTHSLTVVFFSRTYLSSNKVIGHSGKPTGSDSEGSREPGIPGGDKSAKPSESGNCHVNVDVCGRLYEDHFKTVVENETTTDWDSLIVRIKREFVRYPFDVGWNLSNEEGRRPSTAAQGNILEAVNVTLNLMQFHYMDRDLHRVGNSVVIISPGCGVFEVDRGLAAITYQRMMDNGIGSDMLSLGLPPLHTAPFFHYNNDLFAVEVHGVDTEKKYHEVPHWMHLSFFSYDNGMYSPDFRQPDQSKAIEVMSSGHSTHDIEVGANGFFIPNLRSEADRALMRLNARRASFSALANVAASPSIASKSQSRQRQLISGRDFHDILEACRPRNSQHSVPSALSSLLRMYQLMEEETRQALVDTEVSGGDGEVDVNRVRAPANDSLRAQPVSSRLKEWGAIDFDEVAAIFMQASALKQRQQDTGSPHPRDPMSDRSSSPSSFSSQLSGLLSPSLERPTPMLYFYSRSTADGIQMQRCPSIDSLEQADEIDRKASTGKRSEESLCNLGTEGSSSEEQGQGKIVEDDNVAHENLEERQKSDGDYLRNLMQQQDEHFFMRSRAKSGDHKAQVGTTRVIEGPVGSSGSILPSSNSVTGAGQAVGGLGAALQNYNSSGDSKPFPSEFPDLKRNPSGGRLREISQLHSPFALSRSLGPLQGGLPMSQPPAALSRRSDSPDNLLPLRGPMQGMKGIGNRGVKSNTATLVATSPPRSHNVQKTRSPPKGAEGDIHSSRHSTSKKSHSSKRRTHTLNPFKQQDEEAVLAEKSHNRRRWSHVFPLGEIEFKRHAGPNWKSLTQPAILPLTIDYYPPPQELNSFLIRPWDIPLADIDRAQYKSYSELIMEMIRQRLTQDYQVVPQSVVQESRRRAEAAAQLVAQDRAGNREGATPSPTTRSFLSRESTALGQIRLLKTQSKKSRSGKDGLQGSERGDGEVIEHNLSMGHTIHVLKYDPNADEKKIVVEQLSRRRTQDHPFHYKYLLYSPAMKKYAKVVQQFQEFSNEYRWNQVDYLISGIEEKKRLAEMKFRQLMFALIPERHANKTEEQSYTDNFRKLLEYLNKLRESDDTEESLAVQIVSSDDSPLDRKEQVSKVRREAADTMERVKVQLRKGKRDPYEWLDIAVEPTFDTRRSYRIMIHWLVASSNKVETQVQLIFRRCTQYGLKLVSIPQLSISPNLFLNPFNAPALLCIRKKENADLVDAAILERNFVDDGIHMTEKNFLDCIENADEYRFGRRRRIPAIQFVHRSGTLFIRLIRDDQGWVVLAGIENRRLMERDGELVKTARSAFYQIEAFVASLSGSDNSQHPSPTR